MRTLSFFGLLSLFVCAATAQNPICFNPTITDDSPSTGQVSYFTPISFISADFNEDGKKDLATLINFNNVSIQLADGLGQYGTATAYEIGVVGKSIVAADINNDDHIDIVSHSTGDGSINVLLGNGDGTFEQLAGPMTMVYNAQTAMCTGDFDNDGNIDLALSTGFIPNKIMMGNGDGTFDAYYEINGSPSPYIASADINEDGNADILFLNSVVLGNGDGTFDAPITFTGGQNTAKMQLVDLNNDEHLDIISSNMGDYLLGNVSVNLGNGDGTFGTPNFFSVGDSSLAFNLCLGDFNYDTHLDVAVSITYPNTFGFHLAFLTGDGSGNLSNLQTLDVDNNPGQMISHFLNDDDRIDLMIKINGTVSSLFQCAPTNGVADLLNDIKVFPNPSGGEIKIESAEIMTAVSVIDIMGKTVFTQQPNVNQCSFSLDVPGVYFVQIATADQILVKKVLIAK